MTIVVSFFVEIPPENRYLTRNSYERRLLIMVYTMSEILEYAEYAGQMAKIESGCNLIIESAIESLSYTSTEQE